MNSAKKTALAIVAACVLALPVAADESSTEVAKKDLKKFQGEWRFTSFLVNGTPKTEAEYRKYKVFYEGNLWTAYENGRIAAQSTIQLLPKERPKAIDIQLKMEGGRTRLIRGIYRFEKGILTGCNRAEENGERPKTFASEPGSNTTLVTLRRVKP